MLPFFFIYWESRSEERQLRSCSGGEQKCSHRTPTHTHRLMHSTCFSLWAFGSTAVWVGIFLFIFFDVVGHDLVLKMWQITHLRETVGSECVNINRFSTVYMHRKMFNSNCLIAKWHIEGTVECTVSPISYECLTTGINIIFSICPATSVILTTQTATANGREDQT